MEIKRLTPALIDDWVALFGGAFTDNPEWAGCYCNFYEDNFHEDEVPVDDWDPADSRQAEHNRSVQTQRIERGLVHGLLAYDADNPVGWLNAGPRGGYGNLRSFAAAVDPDEPSSIGSVMCFVVHPDHRGRGVGTALLAAVEDHFLALGIEVAEGYPRRAQPEATGSPWTSNFYKGSPQMFAGAGYRIHAEHETFTVVRKSLTP